MDLYTNSLDRPDQVFASDDESAQRLGAMQRMFERAGVLKSPPTSSPIPRTSGPLDNFRLPGGLGEAFASPQRAMRRPMSHPQMQTPIMEVNHAPDPTEEMQGAVSQILNRRTAGHSDEVAAAMAKADAVIASLSREGYSGQPDVRHMEANYRPPRFTPTEGPDTGETNPNAYGAGAPAGYYRNLRRSEATDNPNATNPITKAAGLYQFMPDTWADIMKKAPHLGLTRDGIYDPAQQDTAVRYYTDRSLSLLTKELGRAPTMGELYALHHFGHQGGMNLIQNLDRTARHTVASPAVVKANPWIKSYANKPGRALLKQLGTMMGEDT